MRSPSTQTAPQPRQNVASAPSTVTHARSPQLGHEERSSSENHLRKSRFVGYGLCIDFEAMTRAAEPTSAVRPIFSARGARRAEAGLGRATKPRDSTRRRRSSLRPTSRRSSRTTRTYSFCGQVGSEPGASFNPASWFHSSATARLRRWLGPGLALHPASRRRPHRRAGQRDDRMGLGRLPK
jgi:hypothetical protein